MSKVCLICDTPYQLLNCINLRLNDFQNDNVDLFIDKKFTGYEGIIGRVRETKIFENVYRYNNAGRKPLEQIGKVMYYLDRLVQELRPGKLIKALMIDQFEPRSVQYDAIGCCLAFEFTMAMISYYNANVFVYDEGTWSYLDVDVFRDGFSYSSFWMFRHIQQTRVRKVNVETLYLNNPSLCYCKSIPCHKKLKNLDKQSDEVKDILRYVFNYHKDLKYIQKNIIYISQPLQNAAWNADDVDRAIKEKLNKYRERAIIRKHPFEKPDDGNGLYEDCERQMWELLLYDVITDDSVLIGCASTSQLSPKSIYEKEPWLIYTGHLYEFKDLKYKRYSDEIISILEQNYRKKYKILIPRCVNEISDCIHRVLFKNINSN